MHLSPRQIYSWYRSVNNDYFTVWDGAIRSGKTVISLIAFISWLRNAPSGPVAIIGKTRTTIIRNILDVIGMIDPKSIGNYGMNSDKVKIMSRDVWIIGGNDAQAEAKIRGLTLVGAYVDEITLIPESMFVQLTGRLSVKGARLFGTTNPDSPSHWLKVNYLDRIPRDGYLSAEQIRAKGQDPLTTWGFHHFTMEENPGLTPEYIEAKKREFTGLWYRRFILGEWVSAEGAVYDMWDPSVHVIPWEQLPRMTDCYAVGIDYGTQNPTAAIILARGEDGILYFVDEYRIDSSNRGNGTWTDSEQAHGVLNWIHTVEHAPNMDIKPRLTIIDPAAASFKVEMRKQGAWCVTDAENDVVYGIRRLANGLSSGWLKVSDRCTGLISEISGYSWDPKAQLMGEDKPIKTADHSCDAARYALATTERMWTRAVDQYLAKVGKEKANATSGK